MILNKRNEIEWRIITRREHDGVTTQPFKVRAAWFAVAVLYLVFAACLLAVLVRSL